jgi:putative flippase GtrA
MAARQTLGEFLRYLVTGGTAFIVDAGGFAMLNALGVPVLPAAAASFTAAAIVNYALTSAFVFGATRRSAGQVLGFLAVALVGLALNSLLTAGFHAWLGIPAPLAKVAAIAVTLLWNFTANKRLVFRPQAAAA